MSEKKPINSEKKPVALPKITPTKDGVRILSNTPKAKKSFNGNSGGK